MYYNNINSMLNYLYVILRDIGKDLFMRKFLVVLISVVMIFSMTGLSFADVEEDTTTESTKVEKEVKQEEPKEEEVKKEEPKHEETIQQETEPTTEQVQKAEVTKKEVTKKEVRETIKITLNFVDIRHANGSVTSTSTSNNISPGGSWGFTKTKFERTTGLRTGDSVTYNGREYTYSGKWTCSFNPGVPINADETFRLWNKEGTTSGNTYYLDEDTTLTFTPIYIPKQVYTFTANYIDEIGNGGGGESHQDNGSVGYTHTFKTPADIPENYEFVYWDNETDNETYIEGESLSVKAGELQNDKTINVYATYKPIVTVNYHDEKGNMLGSVTGKVVDVYGNGEVFKKSGKFLGWYASDELIPSDEVKELPLTRVEVQTTFDVYAKYKVVPKPNPDPTPTPPHKPDTTTPKVTETTEVYYGMGDDKEYTKILRTKTPLTEPEETGYWALINLLTVIVNFAIFILLFLMIYINNRKEDEELEVKNRTPIRIGTVILAIISAIIFFITEDMSLPVTWVDNWTPLMIVLLIVQVIMMILCRHKEEDIEE